MQALVNWSFWTSRYLSFPFWSLLDPVTQKIELPKKNPQKATSLQSLCFRAPFDLLSESVFISAALSPQLGMPKMEACVYLSCNMRSRGCAEPESSISTKDSRSPPPETPLGGDAAGSTEKETLAFTWRPWTHHDWWRCPSVRRSCWWMRAKLGTIKLGAFLKVLQIHSFRRFHNSSNNQPRRFALINDSWREILFCSSMKNDRNEVRNKHQFVLFDDRNPADTS